MEKITLIVNAAKEFELNAFKQKLEQLGALELADVLIVSYKKTEAFISSGYAVFDVEDHDDVSFTQLLNAVKNDQFLFFDPELNYPMDFFTQILKPEEKKTETEPQSLWKESLIALQQSRYGLCERKVNKTQDFSFLNAQVLFNKKEIETLNTDKLSVHPESGIELYKYADKKKLKLKQYRPKKKKTIYLTHFREVLALCQNQAQKEFKLFPAIFVLFFVVFGIGAAFQPLMLLVFLLGMSAYLLAIVLEAFGLSTIKKNGGLVPVLLILFPFIHLVYGLECWMAKFKKKS